MKEKKIRKSRDKVLCGVAGGIAEYLGIDPLWIRICFVLLALSGGSGVFHCRAPHGRSISRIPERGRKSEGKGGESECLRSCLQSLCCCFCSG